MDRIYNTTLGVPYIRSPEVLMRLNEKQDGFAVYTEKLAQAYPVLDEDGNPVLLPDGKPKTEIRYFENSERKFTIDLPAEHMNDPVPLVEPERGLPLPMEKRQQLAQMILAGYTCGALQMLSSLALVRKDQLRRDAEADSQ